MSQQAIFIKTMLGDILSLFNAFQQVWVPVIFATHDALGTANQDHKVLHLDHGHLVAYKDPA